MKLIEQLVEYLRERGALSAEQLGRLAADGFIATPIIESDIIDESTWTGASPEDSDPVPPVRRRGKRRKRASEADSLTAKALADALAARFPEWEKPLSGLSAIGRRLGAKPGWEPAAAAVAVAKPAAVNAAVAAALSGKSGMGIWDTLRFEAYRDELDHQCGSAVNAYRAVLRGVRLSEFGKHAWILRYEPVAAVYRLVRAQRAVAAALYEVYRTHRERVQRSSIGADSARALAILDASHYGIIDLLPQPIGAPIRYYFLDPNDADWFSGWSLTLRISPAASALLCRCRTDPFVPVPEGYVAQAHWQYTVGDELCLDAELPERITNALDQMLPGWRGNHIDLSSESLPVSHPFPLIRRLIGRSCSNPKHAVFHQYLNDPDVEVRLQAADLVSYSVARDEAVKHAVFRSLREVTASIAICPEQQEKLLAILNRLGPEGVEDLGSLMPWLGRSPTEIRGKFLSIVRAEPAWCRIGLIAVLCRFLNDPDDEFVLRSVELLTDCGTEASPAVENLIQALGHPRWRVRAGVVATLGRIGEGEAVLAALSRAASDSASTVRAASMIAVGRLNSAGAVPILAAGLQDTSDWVRQVAATSLGVVTTNTTAAANALARALSDPAEEVALAAVTGFGRFEKSVVICHLSDILQTTQRSDRCAAAVAETITLFCHELAPAIVSGVGVIADRSPSASDLGRMSTIVRDVEELLPVVIRQVSGHGPSSRVDEAVGQLLRETTRGVRLAYPIIHTASLHPDESVRHTVTGTVRAVASLAGTLLRQVVGTSEVIEMATEQLDRLIEELVVFVALESLIPDHPQESFS